MDAKAKQVERELKQTQVDNYTPAMEAYRSFLLGGKTTKEQEIAFQIHADSVQREILEALLISECSPMAITTAFRVPVESVEIYKELFFDPSRFPTRLAILSYLENYPDDFGRALKTRAVNLGPEYVLYTYANVVPKTKEQKTLVERLFMTSAYKAMNLNFCGLTSSTGKQAVEHAKLMLKAYEALVKLGNDDTSADYDLSRVLLAQESTTEPATVIGSQEII